MVKRGLSVFEKFGPVVSCGFTFPGGYTETIAAGDGDFLTENIIWDFKTSKSAPNTKQSLQLLVYYLMGKHSCLSIFDLIEQLAIFNPRLNKLYLKNVSEIEPEILNLVSREVIGY